MKLVVRGSNEQLQRLVLIGICLCFTDHVEAAS